jgi:hypothetical protein
MSRGVGCRMNTDFTPVSGRAEIVHTYVVASNKRGQEEEQFMPPSGRPLTPLQRGRMATLEVTDPYFNGEKPLIGQTVRDLKGDHILPWNRVTDAEVFILGKKAMEMVIKRMLREIEWDRFYEYFENCRKKLKENFQRLYLREKDKQEQLSELQVKDLKVDRPT